MRYAKYEAGSATNPRIFPSGVNGITVSTAIPVNVRKFNAGVFALSDIRTINYLGTKEE